MINTRRPQDPVAMVVFGATGDLTQNKLYPALYELAKRKLLPKVFHLYGTAREDMTAKQFVADIRKDLKFHYGKKLEQEALNRLLKCVRYVAADLTDPKGLRAIEDRIVEDESSLGRGILRMYYLALPPSLFGAVVGHVQTCKTGKALCSRDHILSRVILEKPFGYDLATAKKLDALVKKTFDERQVYRIDHYLGKEAFQNILSFRFANSFIDEMWSNKHIAEIQINALETVALEKRFSYYDGAGALRDMVQNHLMQFLSYLTMEHPGKLNATNLRKAKENLLKSVRPYKKKVSMVRGQYKGYRQEDGIPRSSKTETYVALKLEINNERWAGVPIYIRTGKNLGTKETSARVVLKHKSAFFPDQECEENEPNVFGIQLSPTPSITVRMNMQKPDFDLGTQEATMHYCRSEHASKKAVGDYERLLLFAMEGEQLLFSSAKEVLSAWKIVDPFLKRAKRDKVHPYPAHSSGPKAAQTMLKNDGTKWLEMISDCKE